MPWAQTDAMNERLRFIKAVRTRKSTFRSLCATFGVSPKTGYKWLGQFDELGPAGLQDRSRRPHGNSRALSAVLCDRLVDLRRKEGWGPKKLVAWLETNEPEWGVPAPSTVGELLKRRGLVKPRNRERRQVPRTQPLAHADKPNAVWPMDYKGWFRLGDGTRCEPLTVTDAYSRYLLCCRAGTTGGGEGAGECVWAALVQTFREYGLPDAMRVDNGQPWVAPKGQLGITKLAMKIVKLGIRLERIDPGKPQQNGRHERFHLTLQQETAKPPAENLRAQQRRFDMFRRKYNDERPHEALGQRPPATAYIASRRAFPSKVEEPEYPSWYERAVPWKTGKISFRGSEYFISTALRRETVGLVEVEEGCFAVHFCKLLLGHIHTAHPELGLVTAA